MVRSPGTSGFTSHPSGCGGQRWTPTHFSGQSWVNSLENVSATILMGLELSTFWSWVECFTHWPPVTSEAVSLNFVHVCVYTRQEQTFSTIQVGGSNIDPRPMYLLWLESISCMHFYSWQLLTWVVWSPRATSHNHACDWNYAGLKDAAVWQKI